MGVRREGRYLSRRGRVKANQKTIQNQTTKTKTHPEKARSRWFCPRG
jgi:hypothetical protein